MNTVAAFHLLSLKIPAKITYFPVNATIYISTKYLNFDFAHSFYYTPRGQNFILKVLV